MPFSSSGGALGQRYPAGRRSRGKSPRSARQGRKNGWRAQIPWLSDHPNQRTRRGGRDAEGEKFRAWLPFVSRIETSRSSAGGNDSPGSDRGPARGQSVKQGTGVSASLVAILSSVATISCCLPLGFAAALGVGAASAFFTTLRPWLLGLSVVLLGLGFWQQHRAKQCALRGRWIGNVLLWAAVIVVVGMILFPQEIAGIIANRF